MKNMVALYGLDMKLPRSTAYVLPDGPHFTTLGYLPLRYDPAYVTSDPLHTSVSDLLTQEESTETEAEVTPKMFSNWKLPHESFQNAFTLTKAEQRLDPDLSYIARTLETTADKVDNAHNK